jgi:hypothetical protein
VKGGLLRWRFALAVTAPLSVASLKASGRRTPPAKIDEPAAHRTKDLQKSFCRMQPAAYGRAEIFHSSEPF